jgi:hypothetical protein
MRQGELPGRRHADIARRAVIGYLILFACVVAAIGDIQAQRQASCVDQNQRHAATILTLDQTYAQYEAHAKPAQIVQLKASKAFTVELVNDLAPVKACPSLIPTP